MNRLLSFEKTMIRILEFIISFFFVIILLTTISLVILRYVFNSGIYGGNELISYLFVTTALGAAVAISSDEHIKITVFVNLLPRKIQKYVEALSILLVGFLNLILILLSLPWMKKVGRFESPTLRIPNAWVQFGVPLGCAAALLFCFFRFIRILKEDRNDSAAH